MYQKRFYQNWKVYLRNCIYCNIKNVCVPDGVKRFYTTYVTFSRINRLTNDNSIISKYKFIDVTIKKKKTRTLFCFFVFYITVQQGVINLKV